MLGCHQPPVYNYVYSCVTVVDFNKPYYNIKIHTASYTILYNYKSKFLRNKVVLISRLNKSNLVIFLIRPTNLFHSIDAA